jgi:hypothetical protein
MRSIAASFSITGALAAALIWSAAAPAVAGPVCNELDLRSPCVRSNDLRPNIALGGSGDLGSLRVRSADGTTVVQLRASDANVTNAFLNDENRSNGLVKAWTRIAADGTILACWRCNTDPAETRRAEEGFYEVDFTPLATDISGRPLSGTILDSLGMLVLNNNATDPSTVFVTTFFTSGIEDRSFVVMVY